MMYLGDQAVGINNDNRDLKLLTSINIAQSLENDTDGNATAIYNNYIAPIISNQTAPNIIIVAAYNNQATSYALQKMIIFSKVNDGGIVLRKSGSTYSARTINTSTSAWCSQGTVLYIYLLKEVTSNA